MAYSKITIEFTRIPLEFEYLILFDSKFLVSFYETFNSNRTEPWRVKIPPAISGGYSGFTSTNYKQAFNLDWNGASRYTVTTIDGAPNSGLGTVIIESNSSGSVFSESLNTCGAIVTIVNEIVSAVTPSSLTFNGSIGSPEIPDQPIQITTSENWILISELPNWLELSTYSGTGSTTTYVSVVNYGSMEAGIFTTTLLFQLGLLEFPVLVTLELVGDKMVISPYEPNKTAFTLDQKNFTIQSANTNTYFQFDSTISIYKFFTDEVATRVIPKKALLYKGKTEINLGRLIHRLMDKFQTINDSQKQYKLANLNIICKEIDPTDDSVIGITTINNLKFVAGISKNFLGFGFLEFNQKPSRVTVQGFYFLNILIPVGAFELKTYKNSELIDTKALLSTSEGPICEKVLFNEYQQGDIIEFKIDYANQDNDEAPSKKFYIFPEQFFSNVIVWENEFLLQSSFEFTNHLDIKMEMERQSTKIFNGFVEKTLHHSVSKDNKLTINTGWIAKSDIDSLESLMFSKRAFVQVGDKVVDLVPIGKSLTNVDTSQDLYDYTFEFTINKNYNEETYTS